MAIIPISAEKLPAELKARLEKTPKVMQGALIVAAQRSKTLMVRRTPTDRGQMRNAWKVRKGTAKLGAELVNDAPYAGIMELGARPHKVSREGWEAIYEWARRHTFFTVGDGKKRRSGSEEYDPVAEAMAWGVVKMLEKHGYPGPGREHKLYWVRDSLPKIRRIVDREVVRQLRRWSRRKAKR